jgi:acyl transferase domain-containing protein/NAD(P)H-dependent flavin oxidoreductase YrpB (nitropropane dioxygenase family)
MTKEQCVPTPSAARDLVLGVTPFHEPNADLVVAVERAGYLGVLDLGADSGAARAALDRVRRRLAGRPFGVRIRGDRAAEAVLPPEVDTVLLDPALAPGDWPGSGADGGSGAGRVRVLAEVTSATEAAEALRRGAAGLVARGFEGGGRIGELSTFVLVQRLVTVFPGVPVWAMGGIGPHTAAAAVAGGARGVAVDAQLALTAEARLPAATAAALAAMDGSETRVAGGYRVYTRPGLPVIDPASGRFGSRDLREQLLPAGQDAAFAAPLAARYKTAGGVTRAIGAAITAQIELAARIEPLRDAVPVQGPMTRVSDRAEFAAAVAEGGGLPFLALALMPGDQAAELLDRTGELLGGRAWGAGILGFAPAEIREAQLAAIMRVRPPYALIAGGRPSQAATLQEAGIETFLHVPSPGLLGQFLAAGARRFVFEGAECGGHTGPRGSFALWEAQVTRLLEHPDLNGVHAWFAGGIHDERSAAMIAALAAPLAQQGARIGVLMGTAYLFTGEIVESGATTGLYQQTARECGGTALLESSPGHVIRCADTPYVDAFATAKERLAAAGVSQQEAWADLEQLSLGRLRVAAKGLRRDGDDLVTVDEQEARTEGMFMLGQIATLRSEVTSVAALHEQVTAGAASFLAGRAADLRAAAGPDAEQARPLRVAVVGMACVYPGADGLDRYWSNVVAGADSVGEVPGQRWRKEQYPDVPADRGGFIPPVPFDALGYGIPPAALSAIEPVQLLALEVAARALADAGYADRPFDRSRASVIFGAEGGSDLSAAYGMRTGLPGYLPAGDGPRIPAELDEYLPRLTEDSFPGVLGNVIAGRIANRLDLGGVNYSVDAACASSLAALDLACKELAAGTSDVVLCGGADTHNGIHDYEMFASVHALSPSGRCATFDAQADGIALGEGVGCVVLKRLEDAERDGDRVYAVVQGIGGSSDGRSLGLTAPRPEGQRLALERAYAMAGISPAEVGLVEAHGTGTVAGDRAELATLTNVFTAAGAEPGNCAIGSVKSQIGHTKCAAGLAGLIKVAYALHTGTRPGTLHLSAPNGYWDPAASPFTFTTGPARPWPVPASRRHAGVSAFGFGGTNFHAVLSGYDGADPPAHGLRDWPAELFVLRGDATDATRVLTELTAANDQAGRPWRLAELAATMAARPGPVRAAFTAASLDDLGQRLREPLAGPEESRAEPGAVAFLFPGQGSQRPGMTADLFTAFPRLQWLLRLAGPARAAAMFPPAAFSQADRARHTAAITDTRMAQPTLGVADLAVWELLTMTGVRPDMAAGHSYGELAALCAAGVYGPATLLELSEVRANAILAAAGDDPGAMASVSGDAAQVGALLDGTGVVIANHNAPDQVVISGPTAALEQAVTALAAAGLPAKRLGVACAFHSPVVAPAAAVMAEALTRKAVGTPGFPVYANSTARPYADSPEEVRRLLAAQVADPVRFAEQVELMYAAGARTFVEVGPGRTLTGLVGRILGGRPHTAVACDVPGENGLGQFLDALAKLVNAGVTVDPWPLFGGRAVPVTGTPARPAWTVDGQLVRTADGRPLAGGLQPATAAPHLALGGTAPAAAPDANGHDRDSVVTEFLRTTRELVAVQREVVLGYLGSGPLPAAAPVRLPADAGRTGALPVTAASAFGAGPDFGQASSPAASAVPAQDSGPVAAPAAAPPGPAEIAMAVVAVISARTGYPTDMLGADLDLEADLSIDSIKRTEIIAALADRLGLAASGAGADERVMDELSQIKTISGISEWLASHLGDPAGDVPAGEVPAAEIPAQVPVGGSRVEVPAGDVPWKVPAGDVWPEVLAADSRETADSREVAASDVWATARPAAQTAAEAPVPQPRSGAAEPPTAPHAVPSFTPARLAPELSAALRGPADPAGLADGAPSPDGALPRRTASTGAGGPATGGLALGSLAAGAPTGGLPAIGAPAGGAPANGTHANGMPANGMPANGTAAGGTATGGTGAWATVADGDGAEEPEEGRAPSMARRYLTDRPNGQQTTAAHVPPRAARPRRLLVEPAELPPAAPAPASLPQRRFLIVEDGRGVALELADLLEQRGAEAVVVETPSSTDLFGANALVHLGALRPGAGPVLPGAFGLIRDALAVGVRAVLVATGGGGTFGLAPGGGNFAAGGFSSFGTGGPAAGKFAAAGFGGGFGGTPDSSPDGRGPANGKPAAGKPADDAEESALSWLFGSQQEENGDSPGHRGAADHAPGGTGPGWDDEPADLGLRGLLRTIAAEYPRVLARAVDVEPKDSPRDIAALLLAELFDPAGPAVVGYRAGRRTGLRVIEGAPPALLTDASALGLTADSVVLLTGGARGITASVALALARATGCHIELIGRTPPPGPADPEFDTGDPMALRQVLISRNGSRGPREIEAEVGRLLRERQVRQTLDTLRACAASVRYHAADVREPAAVAAVLADVYARFGRIDGVIHGAGVVEDRLITDKTPESFARVYGTKVDGVRALAAGLRGDAKFLVLFGSVSGVFGNRGQADYAAANDALDTLARHWSGSAGRVLAIDWGPWAGGGMVSPELEREYARRGVTLIDPAAGVACLLAELADPTGPAQVVYLCGEVPGAPRTGSAGE